jgi:hypothetical protein
VRHDAQHLADEILVKIERASGGSSWQELLGKRFLYLIWRDPWMAVGKDTYISNFLELMGLVNAWTGSQRYPEFRLDDVPDLNVDVILLSSEPWAFRKRDAAYIRDVLGPKCPALFWIDGKAFSWYGSTTADALTAVCEDPLKSRLIKPL